MTFMETLNLTKEYGERPHTVTALNDVDLTINKGEFISIMGESGAGKSTLLSLLGTLDAPTSGSYRVDGLDIGSLDTEQQAEFRREYLGFVFQSFHLMPYLSVIENVMLPLIPTTLEKEEKHDAAVQALSRVGITTEINRLPTQISGGQKERVALARALVNSPLILLADEPTGNLDSSNTRKVMELLAQLNGEGMTVIMVTHSETCALYAHRVLQMKDGTCEGG
jgi:putative ABC transport system ATP-binding protein